MSNNQNRLIDLKVSILQLAQEMGNISAACKKARIARSSFYEIKKAYEQFGREGLEPEPKRRGRQPNQTTPEQVEHILAMTRLNPSYSYVRIANQLQLEGKSIGANAVRGVWERHGLVKKLARFLWIDQEAQAGRAILTVEIAKKVSRLKRMDEASDHHVEANAPGELLSQDLYFVGIIKGVGKIYMQSAVDCANSALGFRHIVASQSSISMSSTWVPRVSSTVRRDQQARIRTGLSSGSTAPLKTNSLQKSFERSGTQAWMSFKAILISS